MEEEAENNLLHLDISEGPQHVFNQIRAADAISKVHNICLSRNFPSPRRGILSSDDVLEVLENIVDLPSLSFLKISFAGGTFPMHLLLKALVGSRDRIGRSSTLRNLFLHGVKLAYSETVAAAGTLKKNGESISLSSISVENCNSESLPVRFSNGRENPLDILLSAFTQQLQCLDKLSLRSFHNVSLRDFSQFPWLRELSLSRIKISETSLRNICLSPCLRSLELDTLLSPPPARQSQILAGALVATSESNNNPYTTNLHTLRLTIFLSGCMSSDEIEAYRSFWRSMETNTTLKNFCFVTTGKILHDNAHVVFGGPIAEALEANQTLQQLAIHAHIFASEPKQEKNLEQSLTLLAQSLRNNETLYQLSLHVTGGLRGFSEDSIRTLMTGPFASVLKTGEQFTLRNLLLQYRQQPQSLCDHSKFQLDLNRASRHKLLSGNPTLRDWVEMLVVHREQTSIVFYFLSRYPSICQRFRNLQ